LIFLEDQVMAGKLYIQEYAQVAVDSISRTVMCPQEAPLAEYIVDFSGGVAQSPQFQPNTKFIRVHPDSICVISVGTNPTAAVTGGGRMAASQTEYRGVDPSKNLANPSTPMKISAITTT
jgi:hypothetical protein